MEKTSPLVSPEIKASLGKYSHYLSELRKRLLATLLVFAVTTFAGFFFYEKIIKFLIRLLSLEGINIVFTSPFQFINLAITTGVTFGLVVSFPLLITQILFFLKPALKKQEFKMIIRLLPFSLLLFLVGLTFGFLVMKWQIQMFLEKSVELGIGNILDISRLLRTVLLTSVLMGIAFQFPMPLILLLRLGVIKRQRLSKMRLWIYLGSFIFAIFLPMDSILADIILSVPLIILFELTLALSKVKRNFV